MATVVIGAGSSGLAAAAMLQRVGDDVVVLERGAVGAAWRTRYDRLHLHTVRWLSSLPGYRMPRASGKWPSRDAVVAYLEQYAARHRLDVRHGVEVHSVEPAWRVETSAGTFAADRVVVATGHSNVPHLPRWPGTFEGQILHSSAYRNPSPFRGRRVVVVGAGNSGAEIATDLADGGAAAVFLAVRTPPSIVRRDTLGVPSQLLGIASARLPARVSDRVAATIRRVAFPDLTAHGLPAPRHPYFDFLRRRVIPILDVGIVDAVRRGRVRVVAPIDRLDGDAAVLTDGARLDVDVVLAATGFRTGLTPLVGHLGVLDARGEPLAHSPDDHPNAPSLYFVGYRVVLGGTLFTASRDAKRLAARVRRDVRATAPAAAAA